MQFLPGAGFKGRAAAHNPKPRYDALNREPVHDGWDDQDSPRAPNTQVFLDNARTLVSRNRSPDLPFKQSINAYRGCEHGCIYCYARPTHAYLGLSPGLDFESRLFAKVDAAKLLRQELGRRAYVCSTIALGANTDSYQPIEREYGITRQLLEVLWECRHPVSITTKSALIERDRDLLAEMAERGLVQVMISLTTLDIDLMRRMEPRAASPERRLRTILNLSQTGIPVTAMIAPLIPFLTDDALETLLARSAQAGAKYADYILLRLPLELKELFADWLEIHYPMKKNRVLGVLKELHGGRLYEPKFGLRQSGQGVFADLIRQRFRVAAKKRGLNAEIPPLDTRQFRPPAKDSRQLSLF
ncbi:MAG: PA0069 family radical SAM protein [Methylococcaceae bacterium]|nr:PA0069 family radical SAM protein [Methylococcaceae bacterium]